VTTPVNHLNAKFSQLAGVSISARLML